MDDSLSDSTSLENRSVEVKGNMKYTIFTVSAPHCTPEEIIRKASLWGYDGIEWRITNDRGKGKESAFWSGNLCTIQADAPDEMFAGIAEATRKAGLEVFLAEMPEDARLADKLAFLKSL